MTFVALWRHAPGARIRGPMRNRDAWMPGKMTLAMLLAAGLAGCASHELRDSNAAVDANPLCASRPDRPGEPVPRECERTTEASWSTERRDSAPIDFSRKRGDD